MIMKITLASDNVVVRDPSTKLPIKFGDVLSVNNSDTFWLRRIAEGSIKVVSKHSAQKPIKTPKVKK